MNLTLADIAGSCSPVLGGLNTLSVVPAAAVLQVPAPVNYNIPTDLVLKPGARLAQVMFPDGAGDFSEIQDENEHGTFFKQKLSVFVPRDSAAAASWRNQVAQIGRYLVIYTDNNGLSKVVGSPEFPLRFRSEVETGKSATNKNGTTLTFFGNSLHPAYSYLGSGGTQQSGSGAPVTIKKGDGTTVAILQPGQEFIITSGFRWEGFKIL